MQLYGTIQNRDFLAYTYFCRAAEKHIERKMVCKSETRTVEHRQIFCLRQWSVIECRFNNQIRKSRINLMWIENLTFPFAASLLNVVHTHKRPLQDRARQLRFSGLVGTNRVDMQMLCKALILHDRPRPRSHRRSRYHYVGALHRTFWIV
jgi:hypothetical protein